MKYKHVRTFAEANRGICVEMHLNGMYPDVDFGVVGVGSGIVTLHGEAGDRDYKIHYKRGRLKGQEYAISSQAGGYERIMNTTSEFEVWPIIEVTP